MFLGLLIHARREGGLKCGISAKKIVRTMVARKDLEAVVVTIKPQSETTNLHRTYHHPNHTHTSN